MKLLIICAILSVGVAVSLASPVKTEIRDEDNSVSSSESGEIKISKNDLSSSSSSSSSEEESDETKGRQIKIKDSSSEASEELLENIKIIRDEVNENISVEEQDDFFNSRARRAVSFTPHANNQLAVKDEGTIKYEKYLRLKRLRHALEGDLQDDNVRDKRSAKSSEESSSDEDLIDKHFAKGVVVAKKPETAAAETVEPTPKPEADPAGSAPSESAVKAEDIRRKRSSPTVGSSEEKSSEEVKQETAPAETDAVFAESEIRPRRSAEDFDTEDESQHDHEENEVFILSKEQQTENDDIGKDESAALSDNDFEIPETSSENKDSEEDYAQGCGGNRGDKSNENSNEKNDFLNDNL